MRTRAAIFDIDGTLVDSVDIHAEVWQRVLAEFGKQIRFEDVRRQIGKGADTLLPEFLTKEELKQKGKKISEYRAELFKREYLNRVRPFPKVPDLFRRIDRAGIRIALASSSKADEVTHYKKLCGIEDLVDAETSADEAEKSKPYPDIFEAALGKLPWVTAAEALAIGDTPYDAEAAGKSGIRTIGLLSGGFPEEDLRKAGAIVIYRDCADLLERFDASPFMAG
ncbi:MAG: HAD family hydrolase [Verrucomicrobia bacterium]|nr:HAD family hydrolase [Verrucomicrobiota bacterium]